MRVKRPRPQSGDEGPPVLLEREGAVLNLTLNRPRVLNAYDVAMRDALHGALALAHDDPTISVVVVRGNGRAFSSGGDLSEFGQAPSPVRARDVRRVRDVWGAWSTLPCIAIAGVHGIAAGGGLEMALLCDLVVCAEDARFGLPETSLALVPGVGGTQTLPRAVGVGRAAAMLLAGDWVDGLTAARIGIAVEAVPARALGATVERLAARIAAIDPLLLRAVKAAVARGADLPLAQALGLERRLGAKLGPRLA